MNTQPNKPTYDELVELVQKQAKELERQKLEIQLLKEQLAKSNKNSSNSSKRPSEDIVKPNKSKFKSHKRRKRGGQFGHKKYESELHREDADNEVIYHLDRCPRTNSKLTAMIGLDPKVLLQYEFVENPIELTAHLAYPFWCEHCGQIHWAKIPKPVRKAGIAGPRLSAFIAMLKGGAHASITNTQKIIAQLGAPLASGTICKIRDKVQYSLDAPYMELLEALPKQSFLNIDETGHKDQGDPFWNWCFVAPEFTVFKIADSRSTRVLVDVLGKECEAVIGSDHYGAYRKFMKEAPVIVQFCMAHLIRELKFLSESSSKPITNYGNRLLEQLRKIFKLIHRREELGEKRFLKQMEKQKKKFLQSARQTQAGGDASKLAERFKKFGKEYFTFVTHPGIEPTNNIAERAIRFCVIDRKVTQGTRGINGRKWCERIWTTLATCAQRQVNAFDFIANAVACYFAAAPAPSLLE